MNVFPLVQSLPSSEGYGTSRTMSSFSFSPQLASYLIDVLSSISIRGDNQALLLWVGGATHAPFALKFVYKLTET